MNFGGRLKLDSSYTYFDFEGNQKFMRIYMYHHKYLTVVLLLYSMGNETKRRRHSIE